MYGINLCLDCIYNYQKMETVTSKGVTGLHVLYGSAVLILVVLLCPLRYQPPR